MSGIQQTVIRVKAASVWATMQYAAHTVQDQGTAIAALKSVILKYMKFFFLFSCKKKIHSTQIKQLKKKKIKGCQTYSCPKINNKLSIYAESVTNI